MKLPAKRLKEFGVGNQPVSRRCGLVGLTERRAAGLFLNRRFWGVILKRTGGFLILANYQRLARNVFDMLRVAKENFIRCV
jgi:hypothetical protein